MHTTEITFAFGRVPDAWEPYKAYRGRADSDARLADVMSDYWVAFAASGDPNTPVGQARRPWWPAYAPREDAYLELGAVVRARRGLKAAAYAARDRVARARGELRP